MSETAFEPEDGTIPLRRSTRYRGGMRMGPLRAGRRPRATSLPLAMIVILAAAGSAAAVITTQPPSAPVDETPRVEMVSLDTAPVEHIQPRAPETASLPEVAAPEPQVSAPLLELAPVPQAPEPAQAATSAFGLDALPVLEADETSLGIDDALDALSAPVTPPPRHTVRRTPTTVAARPTRPAN